MILALVHKPVMWCSYQLKVPSGKGGDRGGRGKKGAKVHCFLDSLAWDSRWWMETKEIFDDFCFSKFSQCHVGSEVPGELQRISRWEGS